MVTSDRVDIYPPATSRGCRLVFDETYLNDICVGQIIFLDQACTQTGTKRVSERASSCPSPSHITEHARDRLLNLLWCFTGYL